MDEALRDYDTTLFQKCQGRPPNDDAELEAHILGCDNCCNDSWLWLERRGASL